MNTSYKDLFGIHLKQVEYLLAKTQVLNKYVRDIHGSGSEVEIDLREFFSYFLPNRFKVTHGYICRAESCLEEPIISPQVDFIIVDTLFPHSIFPLSINSGQELVPIESVVGVLEIKRTLNKKTLKEATEHIGTISKKMNIDKLSQTQYINGLPTNAFGTHTYSNPLLGIIALDYSFDIDIQDSGYKTEEIKKIFNMLAGANIDLAGSLSGFLSTTMDDDTDNFSTYNYREKNKKYTYCLAVPNGSISQISIISRIIGIILAYLSRTTGKLSALENYYFNRSTWHD